MVRLMDTLRRFLAHPAAATAFGAIIFFLIVMVVGKVLGGEWNLGSALIGTAVYVVLQALLEGVRSSRR